MCFFRLSLHHTICLVVLLSTGLTHAADTSATRLLVQYKPALITEHIDSSGGRVRLEAFSAQQQHKRAQGIATSDLTYLKAAGPRTHVAIASKELTQTEISALIQSIKADPQVEYVREDRKRFIHYTPNDTFFSSQQWALKSPASEAGGANAPNAWGRITGANPVNGTGVIVAVLDTGYLNHADLVANVLTTGGYDFIHDTAISRDPDGRDSNASDPGDWSLSTSSCGEYNSSWHGTHVAGVIAAVSNNNTGVSGLAFGARILPLRVLGMCGGWDSDIIAAMRWAVGIPVSGVANNTNLAKVLNLSLGGTGSCDSFYQTAVNDVLAAGSVIVISSGNDASTSISSPANCTGVIAVTAHTRLGDNASYANVGTGTTISAPGGGRGQNIAGDGSGIYTTSNTGLTTPLVDTYTGATGTSFAAPHVAAVAAMLFQIKPTLTPAQVSSYLTLNARPFLSGTYCYGRSDCGAGMLDAFRTVNALLLAEGGSNSTPVLNAIGSKTAPVLTTLQFTATGTDADGDQLIYTGTNLPSGASLNSETGLFTWSNIRAPGTHTFTIQASDGATTSTAQGVTVFVSGSLPATSSGGGGGGGAFSWLELVGLLALLAAAWGLDLRTGKRQRSH
jgi:serine protease